MKTTTKYTHMLTLVLLSIVTVILTSCSSTPSPLAELEKVLGTPCEEILSNTTYTITKSIMGIQIVQKEMDIFGIPGEIEIFIMPDDEYVSIVTWESTSKFIAEAEINTFVDKIEKTYKKFEVSQYLWQTDKYTINLQIDKDGNSLTLVLS